MPRNHSERAFRPDPRDLAQVTPEQLAKIMYVHDNLVEIMDKVPANEGAEIIELGFCGDVGAQAGVMHQRNFARIRIGMGAVDLLDKFELLTIVAHEIGHVVAAPDTGHIAEYVADAAAVHMTGDPKSVISALRKMTDAPLTCPCCDKPVEAKNNYASHPPMDRRIDAITRLAAVLGLPIED